MVAVRSGTSRTLLALALAAGLLRPSPLGAASGAPPPVAPEDASGDDIFLLTTSVSPLVVLLLDNSVSMTHVEWHPAYDPKAPLPPDCDSALEWGAAIDFTQTYSYASTVQETHCGNTRRIWALANPTLWTGHYLAWYFSDAADPYYNEIRTATAATSACRQSGGAEQFDDKYRRRRFEAAKQVLLDLLCRAESKNVRFAFAQMRTPFLDALGLGIDTNGGFLSADLQRSNPNNAAELESAIKLATPVLDAPLSEALFQVYTYYMPRSDDAYPAGLSGDDDPPLGKDGVTPFPKYQYDKFGNWETNSSQWFEEAIRYTCDKAFVIVVSDGPSTRDDFDTDVAETDQGFAEFANLIGDYHADGETEEPGGAEESTRYLDDIAKYMAEKDFRPDFEGDQTIDTYTIGFASDEDTDAFLAKTAEVGNGLFFHTQDGEQLAEALIAALNDIVEKAQSFTAASVPSARTVDGGDFYQSYFFPSGKSAFWEGHVRAWHIEPDGDITDAQGLCALHDPTPGECNSGFFKPSAEYFWDAFEEVPLPAERKLYTSKLLSGTPSLVDFDAALGAADLDLADFLAPPSPAPNSLLYPLKGSRALNEEGLADEVVAFGRGCFFGTGVETADVSGGVPCAVRPARLGDVFHSNPIVVKRPSARPFDASYQAFKTAYATRSRVLYTGTNGGFLEAIHAGDWVSSPSPGKYDEGTGTELFGFMPWESRRKIKQQPIDSPTSRTHYVDADPQVADVWMYPSESATTKAADGSEWRTVLVGGLREGGREYYALDITNPDGIVGPGGAALDYPGYLWEFPPEGDPDGDLAWMGETFGQPILTRVRVQNGGDPDPKPVYERWVAIVTAGYAETADPNPPAVTGKGGVTWDYHEGEGRGIFLIDVTTGEVLAEKRFVDDTGNDCPASAADLQKLVCYAIVSTPAVFDLDADGFADAIYVGDLGGNVWKWVIHPVGDDRVNDGSGLRTQPSWPFKRFFDAPEVAISGDDHYQNFYFPPAGAMVGAKLWLAFGAGERRNLGYEGEASKDENNRYYVVSDLDPFEVAATPLATVTEANLVDATASPGGISVPADKRGYYVKAADGEKFVTRTEIFGGYVITASFHPVDTGDPCTSRGDATAYIFDLLTGEGYYTDADGNPARGVDIGAGLPTDPKTSIGVGGKDNRVYIEKSGADLESLGTTDIPAGGRLLYWRETP
jgi:type IV pilus assembly protein PilY1